MAALFSPDTGGAEKAVLVLLAAGDLGRGARPADRCTPGLGRPSQSEASCRR